MAPRAGSRLARACRALGALGVMAVVLAAATPAAEAAAPTITANPALYPAFDPAVSDYVVRCPYNTPTKVSVAAPSGVTVSVDGGPAQGGSFTASVNVATGQSFTIVVNNSDGTTATYHARCIPTDFPRWTTQRSGTPTARFHVVSTGYSNGASAPPFVAVFDTNGVPVWWKRTSYREPEDAKLFSNGDIAWGYFAVDHFEERRLDYSLVRTIAPPGGGVDAHDVQLLPNGDYLTSRQKEVYVDMSACGGSQNTDILENVVQELAPSGWVVWSWDALAHIDPCEMDIPWRSRLQTSTAPYDVYHWNSAEVTGNQMILSFRHMDAIYDVDRTTGSILWKLGGTPRPESLSIAGDPVFSGGSGFGGQHDARLLPDGTLTVYDNQTARPGPPRAVRYTIDTTNRVATLVESVTDPAIASSQCCGSSRKLPSGNWVINWGANSTFDEVTPSGTPVFKVTFANGVFSYRDDPVTASSPTIEQLRAGMDARFPRQ